MRQSTLNFNRQLLAGEVGALLLAYVAVPAVAHFRSNPALLSAVAVAATLVGGSLGWIAARVSDQLRRRPSSVRSMAGDLSYFTPAALCCGFCVYDPVIYLLTHYLLVHRAGAWVAVAAGQLAAFSAFLLALNAYRFALFRFRGKAL